MAVAFSSVANTTPATGNSFTINITAPATNPVLLVGIGLDSTTATITSVSWSLGSGTAVEVKTARQSNSFASVWAIPAPTAGAGTITVNISASVPYQGAAESFTGANQITPCSTGDAVSQVGTATPLTITPINLTANDASFGNGVQTLAENPTGITANDRFKNNTTNVNIQVGDSVGTGALTATWDGASSNKAAIGVRIATVPAGTGDDVLIRYGSMNATGGSGLVMAAFADANAGVTVTSGGYYLWYYQNVVQDGV